MFIPASEQAICPNMKMITLEKVFWAIQDMEHRGEVAPDVHCRAQAAVPSMIETVS
ncbi:MAG: quinolinate synthase NadA [Desulfobacteraceae bacterium]|nr:quinolinate synthase NadA [Desulfobacteraceae bacterium]